MPLIASVVMKSWNAYDGGTSLKSTMIRFVPAPAHAPALVSTTERIMRVPGDPALNWIVEVPWPDVIVPPLRVHAYVLPGLSGTLATLPVEPTVTDPAAVTTTGAHA